MDSLVNHFSIFNTPRLSSLKDCIRSLSSQPKVPFPDLSRFDGPDDGSGGCLKVNVVHKKSKDSQFWSVPVFGLGGNSDIFFIFNPKLGENPPTRCPFWIAIWNSVSFIQVTCLSNILIDESLGRCFYLRWPGQARTSEHSKVHKRSGKLT